MVLSFISSVTNVTMLIVNLQEKKPLGILFFGSAQSYWKKVTAERNKIKKRVEWKNKNSSIGPQSLKITNLWKHTSTKAFGKNRCELTSE